MLKYLNSDAHIITLDKNTTTIHIYSKNIVKPHQNIHIFNIPFESFSMLSTCYNIKIYTSILTDLGISTAQLFNSNIGLNTKNNGFLDMRINKNQKIRALDWLNKAKKTELLDIFKTLSTPKLAYKITKNILSFKKHYMFKTTRNLRSLLSKVTRTTQKFNFNSNKIFCLIRIFVNNEVIALNIFLKNIKHFFLPNGILILISFNSLEDRIIKTHLTIKYLKMYHNSIEEKPSINELQNNLAARSAVMRILYHL